MDHKKLRSLTNKQIVFLNSETMCVLCGTKLVFVIYKEPEVIELEEVASCNNCELIVRRKNHVSH